MNILMIALGSTGDILPIAALGKHLRTAGHKVLFVTTQDYTARLQQMGLEVLAVPGNAKSLINSNGAKVVTLFRAFARVSENLTHQLDPQNPILKKIDLIVNQLPVGMYGTDFADFLGVPMIQAAVIPLTPTGDFPLMGWPGESFHLSSYNQMSFRLYEQLTWWYMRPVINRWRQDSLALEALPASAYWRGGPAGRPPTVYGFSPQVFPRPRDWGDQIHITGYWLPDDPDWRPPAELERFIEEGESPVFIGFGSMPVENGRDTLRAVIAALQMTGKKAILHSGYADLTHTELPVNIFPISYAPYRWLLPRMAAIVHHGGSGTTGFSFWSGIPNLAVPFLFDQKFWGDRIPKLGVGPRPIPFHKLTAANLAAAIDQMTGDGQMIRRARELGERIGAESGLENAGRILASYMQQEQAA